MKTAIEQNWDKLEMERAKRDLKKATAKLRRIEFKLIGGRELEYAKSEVEGLRKKLAGPPA